MDSLLDETDAEDLNMVALRPRMPIRERSSCSKQRDQIVQNSGDFQFDRLTEVSTDGQSLTQFSHKIPKTLSQALETTIFEFLVKNCAEN